jgi:hypothetical protein
MAQVGLVKLFDTGSLEVLPGSALSWPCLRWRRRFRHHRFRRWRCRGRFDAGSGDHEFVPARFISRIDSRDGLLQLCAGAFDQNTAGVQPDRHEARQLPESGQGVGRALSLRTRGVKLRQRHAKIPCHGLCETAICETTLCGTRAAGTAASGTNNAGLADFAGDRRRRAFHCGESRH